MKSNYLFQKKTMISLMLAVVLVLSSLGVVYAITTKEKLADEKEKHNTFEEAYTNTDNAVSKARKDVEKAEQELKDANEAYGKAEEKAALAQSELEKAKSNVENPLNNEKVRKAKEELDKQKKILADAEARLKKVKDEIAEGEKAVEAYLQDPTDPDKKAAYEEALAKNDGWADELDAAQQALNTIKTDDYLGDAQRAYDKALKEYLPEAKKDLEEKQKAFDDANNELKNATEKAKAAQENMDKAAKALLDAKEAFDDATDKLDNNNSSIEDLSNKQAIKFPPVGKNIVVKQGEKPLASDAIANKEELSKGTVYMWKDDVATKELGTYKGIVVVDYPDYSNDEVEVDIKVVSAAEEPTMPDKNVVEKKSVKAEPNTGDNAMIYLYGFGLATSAFATLILKHRKDQR